MKIFANTIVQNEDRFLWFAITSIIDNVDKVLIWDTGSTDNTSQIMKDLKKKYPKKVDINFHGPVSIDDYPEVRNEMLKKSNSDWMIIVDGDEVWWDEKIKETVATIKKNPKLDTVVNRYINLVGDMYHKQPDNAGKYNIDGATGNLTIRAMNMKNGNIKFAKPHGQLGAVNEKGVLIQELPAKNRKHIPGGSYLHMTHLNRTSGSSKIVPKRSFKYKYEIGEKLPLDYFYPESFFKPHPSYVNCPWLSSSLSYKIRASVLTPLKNFKRDLNIPTKSGY